MTVTYQKNIDREFKTTGSHSFEDQQVQAHFFLRTDKTAEVKDIVLGRMSIGSARR